MTDRVFDHLILVNRYAAVVQVLFLEASDCLSQEEIENNEQGQDEN